MGNVEFCKKITKTITINGDMFEEILAEQTNVFIADFVCVIYGLHKT